MAGLIGLAYYKTPRSETTHTAGDILIILFAIIGATTTYLVNLKFETGSVLAAAGIGLLGSFLPDIKKDSNILKSLPAAIYCGTFTGMTSPMLAEGIEFILISGSLTGLLLVMSKNILIGFGGKLGTVAFGGVTTTSIIMYLLA
ncbi:hypothetical protein [Christiangramia salexigens]|nr:hypothetical protein [Christiangramia salexigens]